MKSILVFIGIIAVLVVAILAWLHKYQERLIFHPEPLPPDYQFRLPGEFEEVYFNPIRSVFLHALHFKVQNPKGLILYFHGNAGSNASWGNVAEEFTSRGYDCLIYDYPTYGKSNGKIRKESHFHRDANFIYQELLKQYDAQDVIFYGRSLGTGIAARLAATHQPKLLILETPYYSLEDVSSYHYSYLPTSSILRYKFFTNKALPKIGCPITLIHGTNDQVIPYDSSERLLPLHPSCELITIDGGTHNDLALYPEFQKGLDRIL